MKREMRHDFAVSASTCVPITLFSVKAKLLPKLRAQHDCGERGEGGARLVGVAGKMLETGGQIVWIAEKRRKMNTVGKRLVGFGKRAAGGRIRGEEGGREEEKEKREGEGQRAETKGEGRSKR